MLPWHDIEYIQKYIYTVDNRIHAFFAQLLETQPGNNLPNEKNLHHVFDDEIRIAEVANWKTDGE